MTEEQGIQTLMLVTDASGREYRLGRYDDRLGVTNANPGMSTFTEVSKRGNVEGGLQQFYCDELGTLTEKSRDEE